nr:PREDICTED: uncharacterized protein LOC103314704 isoform X3 [Tribolium castaneum]|eukprot:XP_015833496.1 PREDICTED: uncharacterized protein LOC103314704 isoform X3 [Tribolium castaneum]
MLIAVLPTIKMILIITLLLICTKTLAAPTLPLLFPLLFNWGDEPRRRRKHKKRKKVEHIYIHKVPHTEPTRINIPSVNVKVGPVNVDAKVHPLHPRGLPSQVE